MFLIDLFTTLVYQPFLNLLVFIYWVMGLVNDGQADMGLAVIFLTLCIRVLLLPISLAGDRSEHERREIARTVRELEYKFEHDPITLRRERKKVFHKSRAVVVGELVSLFIQVMVALMLWQIFETGLKGHDLHLIYDFMPEVKLPFNLLFLGQYDLSRTNFFLNFLQSVCIFIVETVAILTSPYPPNRGEVVRLQLILPTVSFLIFMRLPAGKKLFVITTLLFSLVIMLIKYIRRKFRAYREEAEAREQAAALPPEEKVLVESKV